MNMTSATLAKSGVIDDATAQIQWTRQ